MPQSSYKSNYLNALFPSFESEQEIIIKGTLLKSLQVFFFFSTFFIVLMLSLYNNNNKNNIKQIKLIETFPFTLFVVCFPFVYIFYQTRTSLTLHRRRRKSRIKIKLKTMNELHFGLSFLCKLTLLYNRTRKKPDNSSNTFLVL